MSDPCLDLVMKMIHDYHLPFLTDPIEKEWDEAQILKSLKQVPENKPLTAKSASKDKADCLGFFLSHMVRLRTISLAKFQTHAQKSEARIEELNTRLNQTSDESEAIEVKWKESHERCCQLEKDNTALTDQLQQAQDKAGELDAAKQETANLQAEITQLKASGQPASELAAARQEILNLKTELDQLKSLSLSTPAGTDDTDALHRANALLEEQLAVKEEEKTEQIKAIAVLGSALDGAKQDLGDLQRRLDEALLSGNRKETTASHAQRQVAALIEQQAAWNRMSEAKQQLCERYKNDCERLQHQLSHVKDQLEGAEHEIYTLKVDATIAKQNPTQVSLSELRGGNSAVTTFPTAVSPATSPAVAATSVAVSASQDPTTFTQSPLSSGASMLTPAAQIAHPVPYSQGSTLQPMTSTQQAMTAFPATPMQGTMSYPVSTQPLASTSTTQLLYPSHQGFSSSGTTPAPYNGALTGLQSMSPAPGGAAPVLGPVATPASLPPANNLGQGHSLTGPMPPATPYYAHPVRQSVNEEIKKISKMMKPFHPPPEGDIDTEYYLQDIEHHLTSTFGDNAPVDSAITLIKLTSSRDVYHFVQRQPQDVKAHWPTLRRSILDEFFDARAKSGITAAAAVKQMANENVNQYHRNLRRAYFGTKNEIDMEETLDFKTLFLEHLHPCVKAHFPLHIEPATTKFSQLKALANKAYDVTVFPAKEVAKEILDIELEGGYTRRGSTERSSGKKSFSRETEHRRRNDDASPFPRKESPFRDRYRSTSRDHKRRDSQERSRGHSRDRSRRNESSADRGRPREFSKDRDRRSGSPNTRGRPRDGSRETDRRRNSPRDHDRSRRRDSSNDHSPRDGSRETDRRRHSPRNHDRSRRRDSPNDRSRNSSRERNRSPHRKLRFDVPQADESQPLRSGALAPQSREKRYNTESDAAPSPADLAEQIKELKNLVKTKRFNKKKPRTNNDGPPDKNGKDPKNLLAVELPADANTLVGCQASSAVSMAMTATLTNPPAPTQNLDDHGTPLMNPDSPNGARAENVATVLSIQRGPATQSDSLESNHVLTRVLQRGEYRGESRKLYLSVTLEHNFTCDALLDTAADITVMSQTLFHSLQNSARRSNRKINLLHRPITILPYSATARTPMDQVAPCNVQIGPMSMVHPIYLSEVERIPLLLGRDLLLRLQPLIDLSSNDHFTISSELREPRPFFSEGLQDLPTDCNVIDNQDDDTTEVDPMVPGKDPDSQQKTFLCNIGPSEDPNQFRPRIPDGIHLGGTPCTDVALALWSERSAITMDTFTRLQAADPTIRLLTKSFRFPLGSQPLTTARAVGICSLQVDWGGHRFNHAFLVAHSLPQSVLLGADIAVRLAIQVDVISQALWSKMPKGTDDTLMSDTQLKAGQTIPQVCDIRSDQTVIIPRRMAEVSIRINVRPGQELSNPLVYFQPSVNFLKKGLSCTATPLLEIKGRTAYLLVTNQSDSDVRLHKGTDLGLLLSHDFYDFGLTVSIIGKIPESLRPSGIPASLVTTLPRGSISIVSDLPLDRRSVAKVELEDDNMMSIYNISHDQPPQTQDANSSVAVSDPRDPYQGFTAELHNMLAVADATTDPSELTEFSDILYKHGSVFAKDSLDCGFTDLHSVRIPTDQNAPPSYVRQYKIPLASYEPVKESIETMLDQGIIRHCNSTYNSPLWPVLKPNKKWRITIDYRELNKKTALSRWPMTQLEQELPKVRDATVFSTIDLASGFWTVGVHPEDQHKLAFTFANRQYTFNRMPFGYANSPAEFNIFLNLACPDASDRGTVIFVDDILLRTRTVPAHLQEVDHVLGQLSSAGAKIVLAKAQWLRRKVNYVGLLIGPKGVEPQSSRIQGMLKLKTPTNVSELRSFLGVCNYSRTFIDGYSGIAQPLTELLRKDVPFEWTQARAEAMATLQKALCSAPCLAYPDHSKPFFLEAGFSATSMSAGLFQRQDRDRRVVAYASKCFSSVEQKFSDCEKALLATVWAVTHFSNYVSGQKVIVQTSHQPVVFLNSQRLRDGVVSNSRVAKWMMAFQGRDIEVQYAQNHKMPLGTGLAICQKCTHDVDDPGTIVHDLTPPAPTRHHFHEEDVCKDMPTVYVDGCSYSKPPPKKAGVGMVWIDDHPITPKSFLLGPQTSQYAEISAVLIALQCAAKHKIQQVVVCSDSNYARLSFTCHLPVWRRNNFLTAARKPVKHKELFLAADHLVSSHDMQVYWKKVKGHSTLQGQDKLFNDKTDELAKSGAIDGTPWTFVPSQLPEPPSRSVSVVTRAAAKAQQCSDIETPDSVVASATPNTPVPSPATSSDPATSTSVAMQPGNRNVDLISLQASDPALAHCIATLTDTLPVPIPPEDTQSHEYLAKLLLSLKRLSMADGLLVYATDEYTSPRLVIPQRHRGVMLSFAHDAPTAGHRGVKATMDELTQVAYWPKMMEDVVDYVKGCLICCQFQPSHPGHRAPLQRRGVSFPWSDIQIDWVGPLTRSSRGNKYFLAVTCAFTKWIECLPAPNDTAETTALLLLNHTFSRFGLPSRLIDHDRGTHFTADVMKELWQLLGVKNRLHISYHPESSGQVERYNRTVVSILRKYIDANQKDWDVKLPLVLMAIRATPHNTTGVSPFEMMTGRRMTLPLHLLYQPGDANLAIAYTAHQYLTDLHEHLKATFSFAQEHLERSVEARKTYYDQKASHAELEKGDQVWYFVFAHTPGTKLSKKFLPKWRGPYLIVDKLSPVAYKIKIQKPQSEPELKWVHRNQIKLHVPQKATQGEPSAAGT